MYSPYCFLYVYYAADKENFFNNLELFLIGDILVTLMFDSGVIMLEEIRCRSLLGVK